MLGRSHRSSASKKEKRARATRRQIPEDDVITTKFWLGGGRFSAVFFRRGEISWNSILILGKRKLSEYYAFTANI